MVIRPTERAGVYQDGTWLYTRNAVPGVAVYGERLVSVDGDEYRAWDATRSKCAAYLRRGGRHWPFRPSSSVLYLGAGTGTTLSHLSDICREGTLVAVEISPRAFRELLSVAERRTNILPILADASKPGTYRAHIRSVDVLYQDVAQRDQVGIFLKNASEFLSPGGVGMLIVKARSTDVAANPSKIYAAAERKLQDAGFEIVDRRSLEPFEEDHAVFVVRRR
ncbi:MAG TPA: fibrillarin-like rRNA/tRNA 2'-O-methyltransferase [Thermoplasmata archaeon]|nr:fibrillarin-like rRNA/tRNA 2'-O-methyltransferase [Thermoplasmata archaeon]